MRALIGHEYSATVRQAFEAIGFEAWSCDLLLSEVPGNHIQGDILELLDRDLHWDIGIFFPPCTDTAVSGAGHFKHKTYEQPIGIQHFYRVWDTATRKIKRVCLENPVSVVSTFVKKPTQTIQPWEFDCPETKRTCLWLHNLPKLIPTSNLTKREARVWNMAPSADRGKERARFPEGIAKAMATQWGVPMLAGTIDL